MPFYKGKNFIEVIKTHFLILKREIEIYQIYHYSNFSLQESRKVIKEEVLFSPKDPSQVLYIASFDQIKVFIDGSYKNLKKLNLLCKEKLSIFPIEKKEESLRTLRLIEK